jgi:hypothetical protein
MKDHLIGKHTKVSYTRASNASMAVKAKLVGYYKLDNIRQPSRKRVPLAIPKIKHRKQTSQMEMSIPCVVRINFTTGTVSIEQV